MTDQKDKSNSLYSSCVKNFVKAKDYYFTTKQIIQEFQKSMNDYKELTQDYIKKLNVLKTDFSKIIYSPKDPSILKYSEKDHHNIIQIIQIFINILVVQIKHFDSFLKGYENGEGKNILIEENDWSGTIKNNLEYGKKQMEKNLNDYENDYNNLMKNFQETEDAIGDYIVKSRKKNPSSNSNNKNNSSDNSSKRCSNTNNKSVLEKFNLTINNTMNSEHKFLQSIETFSKSNSEFFNHYNNSINLTKENFNTQMEYISNVFFPLILTMANCHKMISDEIETLFQKFPDESVTGNNFDNFLKNNCTIITDQDKKNLSEKKKYKIKLITQKLYEDSIQMDSQAKRAVSDVLEEWGWERLSEENIVFTDDEVFKVVQIIYDTFNFVDKSEYILDIEKNKIDVKKNTCKLLSFGFKKKKHHLEGVNKDFEPIKDNELQDLLEKIHKKEYRIPFLQKLNDFRAIGGYEFPHKEFEIIENIFKIIADDIAEEIDIKSTRFLVILSQTFFVKKDDKKYFLLEILKGHKLFTNENILKKFLFEIITIEFDKMIKNHQQLINYFKESKIEQKKRDIVFAQILSFTQSMTEFSVSVETINKVINPFITEYKLNEEMIENINIILNKKLK